jgi:hypothetical protein
MSSLHTRVCSNISGIDGVSSSGSSDNTAFKSVRTVQSHVFVFTVAEWFADNKSVQLFNSNLVKSLCMMIHYNATLFTVGNIYICPAGLLFIFTLTHS